MFKKERKKVEIYNINKNLKGLLVKSVSSLHTVVYKLHDVVTIIINQSITKNNKQA